MDSCHVGVLVDVAHEMGHPCPWLEIACEVNGCFARHTPIRALSASIPDSWKSRTQSLAPAAFASQRVAASTMPRAKTPSMPSSVHRSISAKSRLLQAKEGHAFWSNRLSLLKREVEKAQLDLDHARSKTTASEVAAVLTESVSAQLELERMRDLQLQLERREAIRIQTLEHKIASRLAQQRLFHERQAIGETFRSQKDHHLAEIRKQRDEAFSRKAKLRASVQLEKVHAMVTRVKVNAMRREEARQTFEASIDAVVVKTQELECDMAHAITEATSLVDRIRSLKALRQRAELSRSAHRGLNSSLYHDAS